ncbi:MAG: NAD(P)-dependent glycerol-3-phosphate dehydrogenase [Nitrospinota bacterium]|nr:NAD(P)-dependent glycerol-3-phosphate dehydrogenase [Nitrospinota bacterium]
MKISGISVIGGGAWGTALANHLAVNGNKVIIWAYEKEVADDINARHQNSVFLKDIDLSPNITATNSIEEASKGNILIFAAPSHVMEGIVRQMAKFVKPDAVIVSVTKGIENEKLRLPSQIFEELLPKEISKKLVCFSGPSFAKEVVSGLPTAITAASLDPSSAKTVQKLLSVGKMRVYTNDDKIGVELGGVVKNVVAIAAGISDGMGLGHNARAAIITRGLEETIRLGKKMGAKEKTFRGLSGIGDLVLTASGDLSRNRTVGMRLGAGEKLEDIVSGMKMVAEGVRTSLSIHRLSEKLKVDMPLCDEVYFVCHEGKDPREALADLFGRSLKDEFHG